jgi:D-3-phosphoglycerate dehydrogenase
LLLACARHLTQAHRAVKAGEWARERLIGTELAGKTLGVVGLGRIGSRVAAVGSAFGMRIVAYDPFQDDPRFAAAGAERRSLEELLKLSDAITFHVPATPNTLRMLNRQNLEYIARGAIVVNASRGSVIDIPDLCHALEQKWIRAAGLDVFPKEPLDRNSPLLAFPNVILSPHLGATTDEAFAKASMEAAQKAADYLRFGSTSDLLPPPAAWYREAFAKNG